MFNLDEKKQEKTTQVRDAFVASLLPILRHCKLPGPHYKSSSSLESLFTSFSAKLRI
jgi:hypothetical protein